MSNRELPNPPPPFIPNTDTHLKMSHPLLSPYKASTLAALTLGSLAFSSYGKAAVIVSFEQVGSNVVATWRGDITLAPFTASDDTSRLLLNANLTTLGSSQSLVRTPHPNNPGDYFVGGTATVTTLISQPTGANQLTIYGPGQPFPTGFGFSGNIFLLPDFVGSPSSFFNFGSGSTWFMSWADTTLSAIGAASFNNTLAWTSSAGGTNTVSYTTIPEPGSVLLGALGSACLLRRRRGCRS